MVVSAHLSRLALIGLVALPASACDDGVAEPHGELDVAHAPVMNGESSPQITPLSAAEQRAIGFLASSNGDPFCSGTLITGRVVLTAYHCVEDRDVDALRFGVGQPASPLALIEVERVSLAHWETDVALLQLETSATSVVSSVSPLPFNRDPLDSSLVGEQVEAAGYHAISGVSRRRFGVMTVGSVYSGIRTEPYANQTVCKGDSGGPLLLTDALGRAEVAGTAIGGDFGCVGDAYFSRVDLLEDWIDEELAWFGAGGDEDWGGGPSQGERRVHDPWGCQGGAGSSGGAPLALSLLAMLALTRRRTRATR